MVGRTIREKLIKIKAMLPKRRKLKEAHEDLARKIKKDEEEAEDIEN